MNQPAMTCRSTKSFEADATLVVVVEMSRSVWLVAGLLPGIDRRPLKKMKPDENELVVLLEHWRGEVAATGRSVRRVVVAYEAGRDGFWLARWLRARNIECEVIHASSIAVSRDRKRAKTDRLDTALLMRALLGWLRGEQGHCTMVSVPSIEEEDAKRSTRERENLVGERTV